jgi:hypothetical protein
MIIELKKFGIILNSRQSGREAFMAFSSNLEKGQEVKNLC